MSKELWPTVEAKKILTNIKKFNKETVIFETGYGPSGLPHIGTFGEVVRTVMIIKALQELDATLDIKLIVMSDDMDGLRKIPSNIPNAEILKDYLDMPLTSIPDPFGECESYGHYMNSRLKEFLDIFGFQYEFKSATECYKSGIYDEKLLLLLKNYDKIMNIMLPTLREERKKTYSPFLPVCKTTGKVLQVKILDKNLEKSTIIYEDLEGNLVESAVTGGKCKLQWKPDWGMRWAALEVDYEMYGKDLQPSADISSKICTVLGGTKPELFMYELFLDGEGKKISKSKGNGLTIEEWLLYGPQESLSLFMFNNPKRAKRLHFDVIPKIVDEYLMYLKQYKENSSIDNPVWFINKDNIQNIDTSFSYSLILNLVSVSNSEDKDILIGFLKTYNAEIHVGEGDFLDRMIECAVRYYHKFIKPNKKYINADSNVKSALTYILENIEKHFQNGPNEIQQFIYEIGKKFGYSDDMKSWFKILYQVLLGQTSGPKIGSFFYIYGINNTKAMITKILESSNINV